MSEIGFTIVGLGVGVERGRMVQRTPGAKLVGVVDINAALAQKTADELGCQWTTKLEDALSDPKVDVVIIMTPSGLHGPMAIAALEAGKHAITAKPMEVTLAKCDAMLEAQEKSGRLLGVEYNFRYHDANQKIRYGIDHGLFGQLILGEARLKCYRGQAYYDKGGWRGTWALDGGGALANQTTHFIDLLCWFMGRAKRVTGKIRTFTHQIEAEDLGLALIEFESGAVGTVVGSTTAPGAMCSGVEIHGSEGGVLTTRQEEEWFFLDGLGDRQDLLQRTRPHTNIVEDVVSALNEGTTLVCDGQEARYAVELLTAIYESGQNGGTPVEL